MTPESLAYLAVRTAAIVLAWVVTYALHSTLLLGAAWMVSSRVRSVQLRETLWRVALIGGVLTATLYCTGAVRVVRPPLSAAEWVEVRQWQRAPLSQAEPPSATPAESASPAAERYGSRLPAAGTLLRMLPLVLVMGWLAFAGFTLGRVAVATRRARRSLGPREDASDPRLLAILREAGGRLGLRRTVRLTISDALRSPVALGRSEICIPSRMLAECSEAEQRAMLAHEAAHIVRRDPAWLLAAVTLESLFFFQPLNRVARVRLQDAAEYLSDELAVGGAHDLRLALARSLARVGEWLAGRNAPLLAPALGESHSSISGRVRRLLASEGVDGSLPGPLRWGLALAALALVVVLVPGARAGTPRAWGTPAFHWAAVVPEGAVVEIEGILGGITARPAEGREVVVRATRHGRATDPDIRFEVVRTAGRVTVCALYPTPAGTPANRCIPGRPGAQHNTPRNDVEIEFALEVPRGVALRAYTSTGGIRTGLLHGPVHAETAVGDIEVASTSYASARSSTGNVRLRMGGAAWSGRLEVATTTGNIRLTLPRETQARLDARSEVGRISSDFPLRGHRLSRWERLRPRGSLGEDGTSPGTAGASLVVTSNTGNITLRRGP